MAKTTTTISTAKFTELRKISSIISENKKSIESKENSEQKDYFSSKENALSAILPGYVILPKVYHSIFVDPIKELFTNHFDKILQDMATSEDGDIPFRDWLDAIQQRKDQYLREPTHAFHYLINDLFAGWLDSESRFGIKPPDNEVVPPLVRWGRPDMGPYTVAVRSRVKQEYGISMSVVTMGPALSRNIAMWGSLAHECGHDITLADNGLLEECTQKLYSQILNARELQGQEVVYNGSREPLPKRAAEAWAFWISETVADVLGLLNFGPSSGISFATMIIGLRNGVLSTAGLPNDRHPIDALRVFMAADLVRDISSLNADIRNSWADALIKITEKYIRNKNTIELQWVSPAGALSTVQFPFEAMRETTKVVAKTLAFDRLETLENHYLAEINTWADNDEAIAVRIADNLVSEKEPSIESGFGETKIYPAHLIAGAVYALTESSNMSAITDLTISALSRLYDKDKVWSAFPLLGIGDLVLHSFIPSFNNIKRTRKSRNARSTKSS
jgi:hypothetical protein